MSGDQHTLKIFLSETRERANKVLNEEHVGADVRNVIKDLLQVADSFSTLMQENVGQSADVRVWRKKHDQVKAEARDLSAKMDAAKKAVQALVEEIKQVSAEAAIIAKRHDQSPQDPDLQSAARIRLAAQKMVALIVQLGN